MKAIDPIPAVIKERLIRYRDELSVEWERILGFWQQYMVDETNGGFLGSLDNSNQPQPAAEKGVVLNSRILWTFSAACRHRAKPGYREIADRAFNFLRNYFYDEKNGGVYWSLNSDGTVADGKKQLYGQAFYVYGLAEYYKITANSEALETAKAVTAAMEKYGLDKTNGGYWEAFSRNWGALDDLRLSEKDENAPKTMNTHLHIIEAYANLYSVWPDATLGNAISNLLAWFERYILEPDARQLRLFMQADWSGDQTDRSFGHDIEAAWLLQECARILGDKVWINTYNQIAATLAASTRDGLDKDGGLWYEQNRQTGHWIREKHWWPQAEAMVGFFNAWELSGDPLFLDQSIRCWDFTRKKLVDTTNGEWYWGIDANEAVLPKEKAGFWKCPYHNSRACLEIITRINAILGEKKV